MRAISIVIIFVATLFPATFVFAEDNKLVEIFAHLGVQTNVPENTFAALQNAIALGIEGIEVDVRQTKDNQLILMHDETIDRTTDGKGHVDQLLYAEIQQYDAGSRCDTELKKEQVPLLSDVLKFCKINNLKLILNVRQTCLEKQVIDTVRECEMSSQVYLWGTMRNFNTEDAEQPGKELVYLLPEETTVEKINRIHEEKKYAFSGIPDSDDRKIIKKQIKMGVDVILVDYPCVAMDILNVKGQTIAGKRSLKNTGTNHLKQETNDTAGYIQEKVKTLVKTIEDTDYDKARAAAMALMVLPPKYTIPPLLNLIKNKNPEVRQNAVWILGFCGEENTAVPIQSLLEDKNAEVRREAVLALRRLGATQSIPILIETLKTETNPLVKYDIAKTLGIPGNRSAVFPLITVLKKEKNWYVKSACVEALGHIGSDKAVDTLAQILTTDGGEDTACTRAKAAWALAEIGEKSIPLLTNALRDNEEVTRRRAGWALVKIGTPAVKELISSLHDSNKFTRERAAQTLGWIGNNNAVSPLIWALKDKELSVVSAVAWALGKIGDPKALSVLNELINNKDNDLRENAVEAVDRITANKEQVAARFKESAQEQ